MNGIDPRIRKQALNSLDGRSFKSFGALAQAFNDKTEDIAAADRKRAKGLRQTQAARHANRIRRAS